MSQLIDARQKYEVNVSTQVLDSGCKAVVTAIASSKADCMVAQYLAIGDAWEMLGALMGDADPFFNAIVYTVIREQHTTALDDGRFRIEAIATATRNTGV